MSARMSVPLALAVHPIYLYFPRTTLVYLSVCLSVCVSLVWIAAEECINFWKARPALTSPSSTQLNSAQPGLQMQIADISRYGKIHVRYACVLVYVLVCVCIWLTSPERANVAARMHWLVIDRKLLVFQFVGNNYAIDIVFLDLHEHDKLLGQFHLNISSKIYDKSDFTNYFSNQNFLQCKT